MKEKIEEIRRILDELDRETLKLEITKKGKISVPTLFGEIEVNIPQERIRESENKINELVRLLKNKVNEL